MYSMPRLLQGVFTFQGRGYDQPTLVSQSLSYVVPMGKRAQFVYFRAGNSSDQMIYVVLKRDGQPMRYFPIGARADSHVALAVVEDLLSDTRVEAYIAAPEGTTGTLVVDIGLVEI